MKTVYAIFDLLVANMYMYIHVVDVRVMAFHFAFFLILLINIVRFPFLQDLVMVAQRVINIEKVLIKFYKNV